VSKEVEALGDSQRPRERWGRYFWRAVLLIVAVGIVLLAVRGVRTWNYVAPSTVQRQPAAQSASTGQSSPVQAYAASFAATYLTYNSADQDGYRRSIQPFLADGLDPMLGWNGAGKQQALMVQPVSVTSQGRQSIVTVAAEVTGGRWLYLAVPVASDGTRFVVTATPAIVPGPGKLQWSADTSQKASDTQLVTALQPNLQAFFQAYANGDATELGYYAAPGSSIPGLGGTVTLQQLGKVWVSPSGGDQRDAVATVQWQDKQTGATYAQSYELTLVQSNGKWLVSRVNPAKGAQA
jgi:hypothetical protein